MLTSLEDQQTLNELLREMGPAKYEMMIQNDFEESGQGVLDCIISLEKSRNIFHRRLYLRRLGENLEQGGKIQEYVCGIMYADKLKRPNLIEEFVGNMVKNHPMLGRLYSIGTPFLSWRNPYK